jgi:hypothetical protein
MNTNPPRAGMPWTEEDRATLALMMAADMPIWDMAATLQRSVAGVAVKVRQMGDKKRPVHAVQTVNFLSLFGNCTPGIKREGGI